MAREYEFGSGLEVPGIEGVIEYGDASKIAHGRIPGAMLINDRSKLEQVHIKVIDGLHDEAEARDARLARSGNHGERAGLLLLSGKTLGLTGDVRAGNVAMMRDLWRRLRGQFGFAERDLIVHPPNEVILYVNEIKNPEALYDNTGWASAVGNGSTAAQPTIVTDGSLRVFEAAATGAGATSSQLSVYQDSAQAIIWSGEDVWLSAKATVYAATASASNLRLVLRQYAANGTPLASIVLTDATAVVASPSTGAYYDLHGRLSGSSLARGCRKVSLHVEFTYPATTGSYTLRATRLALVLATPEELDPMGYFGPSIPGFEQEGSLGLSRSYGPCYQVNQVHDADSNDATQWTSYSTAGATVTGPLVWYAWPEGGQSIYYSAVNPTATSRALSFGTTSATATDRYTVASYRRYRVSARVNLITKLATNAAIGVVFSDRSGVQVGAIAIIAFLPSVGEYEVSEIVTAPQGAVGASLRFYQVVNATAINDKFEAMITKAVFVDVSDYDPGDVEMDGESPVEYAVAQQSPSYSNNVLTLLPKGVRRRVPRPFLVRRVRSIMDGRAPEQQSNLLARRDFTMSLRASDPRVYPIDLRSQRLLLTGTPKLASVDPAYATYIASAPVPPGFTGDGHSVGAGTQWQAGAISSILVTPLGGASSAGLARFYRSLEGYVYNNPRVIIGGGPYSRNMYTQDWGASLMGGSWRYHYVASLLKRVSASTWIEARWTSSNHTAILASTGSATAPYSIELWCSHNASGVATPTALGQWDISQPSTGGDIFYLSTFLDTNNVVWVELWRGYPSAISFDNRIFIASYSLPSPLVSLLGSSITGSTGLAVQSTDWNGDAPTQSNKSFTLGYPYNFHFESQENVPPAYAVCSATGQVDTPESIELRGDVVNPIVTISSPSFDGNEPRSSVARLSGTFLESNPVTIDLSDSLTIKDSSGVDVFDRLMVPSSFVPFTPGVNLVSLQASSWGTYPQHGIVRWRDALR